jgi:uncharacterized protein (DUF1501 family)
MVESINRAPYTPANGAQYNQGDFGKGLQQIARLIKADVGVEAAFADIGSWDHHSNETGQLNGILQQFGSALAPLSSAIWATAWKISFLSRCRNSGAL